MKRSECILRCDRQMRRFISVLLFKFVFLFLHVVEVKTNGINFTLYVYKTKFLMDRNEKFFKRTSSEYICTVNCVRTLNFFFEEASYKTTVLYLCKEIYKIF